MSSLPAECVLGAVAVLTSMCFSLDSALQKSMHPGCCEFVLPILNAGDIGGLSQFRHRCIETDR